MQVGVRHQREEARTLDRSRELALITRLGAGDARWNDACVFGNEFLQHFDVLVVDLLDLVDREAAKLAALEQAAIGAFTFLFANFPPALPAFPPIGRAMI